MRMKEKSRMRHRVGEEKNKSAWSTQHSADLWVGHTVSRMYLLGEVGNLDVTHPILHPTDVGDYKSC